MLPDRRTAWRSCQALSVACFTLAALAMVAAGSLLAGGRDAGSSLVATLGYALGVFGIATGVIATVLEPKTQEASEES